MKRAKYISNGTITYKITGDQGPKGDTGKSAYQIAVDNGYKGTESEWLETLKSDSSYIQTNNVDGKLNIPFVDGAIDGSGQYVSSSISSRVEFRKFDTITTIFSLVTTSIYMRKNGKITAIWSNVQADYPLQKIITDLDAEYGFSVATKQPSKNVFFYGTNSLYYDLNYNMSVNIPLNCGIGLFKNENGTLKLQNPSDKSYNKCNPITPRRNGFVYIDNPSAVSCIMFCCDKTLKVLSRQISNETSIKFDVQKGYIYWLSFYDSNGTFGGDLKNVNISVKYEPQTFEHKNNTALKSIDTTYEIGTIDGAGGLANSNVAIRTDKIHVKKGDLVVCTFPTSVTSKVCATVDGSSYKPIDTMMYSSFSMFAEKDEDIRFTFYKQDLTQISSVSEMPTSEIQIYILGSETSEICLYTGNSRRKGNVFVNSVSGQRIMQALFDCLDSITVHVMDGDYYFDEIYTTGKSKEKAYLYTNENWTEHPRVIEFIGEQPARLEYNNAVRFHVSSTKNADACILATRKGANLDNELLSQCVVCFKNICIVGTDYTQDFVYIDLTHAQASMVENCVVRGDGKLSGVEVLETMPNEKCVGIRVGYGSNNGIQNYVKHCMCYAVGTGFSNCGEHFIMEDNLAHHCKIGFAFGDRLTRGNYEHPNIMIGCSIEGCYRLMVLNRYGSADEIEAESASNTLVCIGLSTEIHWEYPKDNEKYNDGNWYATLPIKEIIKGAYHGRIEADYRGKDISIFENDGSGKNMVQTTY